MQQMIDGVELLARKKNLIPALLKKRSMTIPQFQLEARLPWATAYKIATDEYIGERTGIGTLQAAADALGVPVGDLYEIEGD